MAESPTVLCRQFLPQQPLSVLSVPPGLFLSTVYLTQQLHGSGDGPASLHQAVKGPSCCPAGPVSGGVLCTIQQSLPQPGPWQVCVLVTLQQLLGPSWFSTGTDGHQPPHWRESTPTPDLLLHAQDAAMCVEPDHGWFRDHQHCGGEGEGKHAAAASTQPGCWLGLTPVRRLRPLQVLVAIVSLLLLARVIEPVYGSTEFLKYILVVDLCSCFATFVMAYFVFMTAPQAAKGKTL